ncbi:MAG: alpha/beta fold hydrolase [Desulfomonile sp.]
MVTRTDVFITCGILILEGVLETPSGAKTACPGAVICHPHPLFGGNMHDNVTRAVKNGLLDRGMICLRFNFRGTGQSEGSHGNGVDELEDVRAALDFVDNLEQVDSKRLVVAGYSFGCWVGLRAAIRDRRPARLIGISPPVNSYDFEFLKDETRPKLLIAGDRDFVCSKTAFLELVEEIPEPKMGVVLPGADHFHIGQEDYLVEHLGVFLDRYPF